MIRARLTSLASLVLLAVLSSSTLAHAQAPRTWVSGVGDDVNPCSRTAPCKTFPGAISKTAVNGEIDTLDPGGFGAVTVVKSISIIADGIMGGISASGTNGVTINAAGGTVVLRGLVIDGETTGIKGVSIVDAAAVHIEHCVIRGFTQYAVSMDSSNGTKLYIEDSDLRENAAGIFAQTASPGQVLVERTQVDGNATNGIRIENGVSATIAHSFVNGNGGHGIVIKPTTQSAVVFVDHTVSDSNGQAGIKVGGSGAPATARISNDTIAHNNIGLQIAAQGTILSFGNNSIDGNGSSDAPSSTVPLE